MTVDLTLQDITANRPAYEDVARQYEQLEMELDGAANASACVAVISRWDDCLRDIRTWLGLTNLQSQQDTTNEEYKKERKYSDTLRPKLAELGVRIKRKILASPNLDGIASHFGETALQLWQAQVNTYVPAIEEYKVTELELEAEYTRLIASARIPFGDETYRISEIGRLGEDLNRNVRYEARKATWQWFADNCGALDRMFDNLVQVRTKMAKTLGFDSFVGLAYQRMCRLDYDRDDVARFRAAIHDHVVPLTVELRKQKAKRLGLERLYEWDLPEHSTLSSVMRQRPVYLLAVTLLTTSAFAGAAAKQCAAKAASASARAAASAGEKHRESLHNESDLYAQRHDQIAAGAFLILLTGLAGWAWSFRRKEAGLQSVPLVLTVLSAFVQLMMV